MGLSVKIVTLGDKDGDVKDISGKFKNFLTEAKAEAMIVRPDFYVFGDASTANGVNALVGSLKSQMEQFGLGARTAKAVA